MTEPIKNTPDQELSFVTGGEVNIRQDPWWWLVAAVAALILVLVVAQPDPFKDIVVFARDGIAITVLVTVVSYILMLVAGLFGGLGRMAKNKILFTISTLYVEIVRGIPLLVQLIAWYFASPVIIQQVGTWLNLAPLIEYRANPIVTAIIAITVCYGAYMSEIVRAGIQSIPKGQMEAARSLGMSHFQAMRFVVLPQAFRVILPPMGNEFIALLKDSSLVSVVAVADLTRRGREFMAANFNPIETWTMVALLYLIMTLFAARIVSFIEKKTRYER
ncbi:amino acid ABC transporter permease [Dehalogenimonas alkenigignens]|uniref:Amino acid ABC transporter membrane protein, PAAT family n=1 Tax=Dehalogenimonas alkenigignens TaxID=1217799 RepID=A0A0W0GHR9_9CHLR|nr:amino acid ABC transporter permease [Dehalogenimonas alkenigignens]KTB48085.1 amino acid ABC transporter membrane protein, PAAT family [Dehalogenimonas alkenigignens]PVV84337.1 amino acid ABC transporter permease [Dehalogenimonas alkenigignens]